MEKINSLMSRTLNSLQSSRGSALQRVVKGGTELIPYSDTLTEDGIKKEFVRIQGAFPALTTAFYLVLAERLKESEYTDMQLHDAVNYLIDTCTYPQPTIANIMSFKNNVKLHTYTEICNMVETAGKAVWDEYVAIDIDGMDKKVWVKKIDAVRYKLLSCKWDTEKWGEKDENCPENPTIAYCKNCPALK